MDQDFKLTGRLFVMKQKGWEYRYNQLLQAKQGKPEWFLFSTLLSDPCVLFIGKMQAKRPWACQKISYVQQLFGLGYNQTYSEPVCDLMLAKLNQCSNCEEESGSYQGEM